MSITSKLHKGSPLHILATMLSSAPDKPEVRPYMNVLGYVTKCERVMNKGERETIFDISGGELKYNAEYKIPASSIVPLQITLKKVKDETVNYNIKEAIDKILDQCYPIATAAAAPVVAAAAPVVAAAAPVAAAPARAPAPAPARAPAPAAPVAAVAARPAAPVAPVAARPAAPVAAVARPAPAPAPAPAPSARIVEGDLSNGGIWGFGSHGTPNSHSIPLMNTIYTFDPGNGIIMYTTPPMPEIVPPVYSKLTDEYAKGKATQFRTTPLLHIKANIRGKMKIYILDDTTPSNADREVLINYVERIIK